MLSFGAILFSGADHVAQQAWRTIPRRAQLSKGGRWSAGTLYEDAGPAANYVTFIGSPLVATIGYCGDADFVARIRDASTDIWPTIGPARLECAFVAFNEEPIPRFLYFEGAEAPRFVGNKVYGAPVHRDWMVHISRERLFKRKLLRNVYPINILSAEYFSHLMDFPDFSCLVSSRWLEVFELPNNRFGFFVEPEQQAPLFEMLSGADLVVDDVPVDPFCFVADVRTPRPTLFPVYELFEHATKLTI